MSDAVRQRYRRWRVVAAIHVASIILLAGGSVRPAHAEVTTAQLRARIKLIVDLLKQQQNGDGSWVMGGFGRFKVGTTSLAVLALRAAGVPANDPRVQGAADFLMQHGTIYVYEMSLRIMALAEVNPVKYQKQIADGAQWLVIAQHTDGISKGGWGYNQTGSRADNSISQFALLGLRSASKVGVMIPNKVWRDAMDYYIRGQQRDGGWQYLPINGQRGMNSYGSMTAAGVASLYICSVQLHIAEGTCGKYESERNIFAGINWLGKNFSVRDNPGRPKYFHFYYLYALERAGVISARRYFGNHDWYREGVEYLVGANPDLTRNKGVETAMLQQCFALLFLAKGRAPVLIHKAEWLGGSWNKHRLDAEFLTEFISYHFERPLSWQTIDIRRPVRELLEAPILYINGSGRLVWTDRQIENLKEYIAQGGFLMVNACKSDREFNASFQQQLGKLFPNREIVELPKSHAVYTSFFNLTREQRVPLYGFNTGHCKRSPLIYSPNDLSCEWDIADYQHFHFKLGANIAAYATGLEKIKEKLDPVVLKQPPITEKTATRGAFTVGEIVHPGEWHPHQNAWPRLLNLVRTKANVDVVSKPVPIRLNKDDPYQAHILYLTGYDQFKLSDESKQALKHYLERGGFLFAEAFCGSEEFDKAFRKLVLELFPQQSLERLPLNHSLFKLGKSLGTIHYTRQAQEKYPGLDQPFLEYVTYKGRVIIVYSKFDLSSAIDQLPCFDVIGVKDPDATQIALKIVLFSLAQ